MRPALGLTAYLADPGTWAEGGAARALKLFLEMVPPRSIGFYATSVMMEWKTLSSAELPEWIEAFSSVPGLSGPRHHFTARLADLPNVPETGFSYTEINPKRATRAGVLEVTFPCSMPPERLMLFARRLTELGPLFSLVGGYVVRWSPIHQKLAFNQIYLWARRFVGFDVQVAEEMAWVAPSKLPGVGWLTIVGHPLQAANGIEPEALRGRRWQVPVHAEATPAGVLLRAGEAPSWGDVNAMEWPAAYAEVAHVLASALPESPPRFWGAFSDAEGTLRWQRRFLEPAKWAAP